MADKTLEQMLEHLVNNEQEKAEELFHEYVVAKSREIYETLVEDEVEDEVEEATEEDEEAVEEATEEDDEEVSEDLFDDDVIEADDDMDTEIGDETDALAGALEEPADMDSQDDENEQEIFQDLEDIIDELQAKFDELKDHEDGEEEMHMGDEDDEEGEKEMPMGDDEEMKDDFDAELATVREYVEKIGAPSNTDTADNKQSIIDDMENNMGGTTANILSDSSEEKGRTADKPKVEDFGNENVPGGKASKSMSKVSSGAATSESGADNTDSLFRGKRS